MFFSTILLAATAAVGVSAQNYSTSGPLSIVPDSVAYNTRLAWCVSENNNCREICGGQATVSCDANTLNYTCMCTSGNTPNISAYMGTMPYFVCEQWIADCVQAHPNDLDGITACRSVTCGTKNASSESTTSSAASSATSTGSAASTASSSMASSTGTATSSSTSSSATSSSAAIALGVAKTYGTGILAAAMFAVFGLAL
ncbi:Pci domain-containing protein [Teratosphaeria destructans]|uniref:Pci domain-containing protein n=1 Tax=Teratosphaeria destructans TaxID=418781 RepID=A0A9W7SZT7_9PEZI|nr:Pci domain-containing protein [Teratosphaeria destructans]